jgi:hypothetical protein
MLLFETLMMNERTVGTLTRACGLDAAVDDDRAATAIAGTGLDLRLDLHACSFVMARRCRRAVDGELDVIAAAATAAGANLRLDLHGMLLFETLMMWNERTDVRSSTLRTRCRDRSRWGRRRRNRGDRP